MKKIAIMQPYFFPYIGYWQLIHSVDEFVVYDNIQYTKKGWFNRNRILENGHDRLFTIPIKKDSDYLPVDRRYRSDDSDVENARTLKIIQANYKKAPYFADIYPLLEDCFMYGEKNLFLYIRHCIERVCQHLDITTRVIISSEIPIDHTLKAERKVIAICKEREADIYINSIGGLELYDKAGFAANGLALQFIKSKDIQYAQFTKPFVPNLSIIDVLMFNDSVTIKHMLQEYELV